MDTLSLAHLDYMRVQRNAAVATIAARRAVLSSLGNAGTATREEVEAWWDARADKSRSTRNSDLSHLRRFYRWCHVWEHRTDDPTLRLEAPRLEKGIPNPVSRADLHRLLATSTDELRRAVALGAYAGLRVSESARLAWDDIDLEMNRIRIVQSKGLKTRNVGLSVLLLDHLLPNTGGNVITAGGRQYQPDTLQRKLNRAMRRAGVPQTSHGLRHRFGTIAHAETGDIAAVARAMGHESYTTTARYVQVSDDALDRIANAVTR